MKYMVGITISGRSRMFYPEALSLAVLREVWQDQRSIASFHDYVESLPPASPARWALELEDIKMQDALLRRVLKAACDLTDAQIDAMPLEALGELFAQILAISKEP